MYQKDLDFKGHPPTVGHNIVNFINTTVKEQYPEYLEFFPFKIGFCSNAYMEDNFYCLQVKEMVTQIPHVGELKDQNLIELCKNIYKQNKFPSFNECFNILSAKGYEYGTFTYIGDREGDFLSSQHLMENILDWLNNIVAPQVMQMNIKRVTDAIPTPPKYDTVTILDNIYVIESEEGLIQGTAFHLKNTGLITCDHCVRSDETGKVFTDLKIFKGSNFNKKISVTVQKSNPDLDIAILTFENEESLTTMGLDIGDSDSLKNMDHIAIAGFPNYNFGDNGIFSPGLIIGFRTYSGVRHLLVNTPLISGNSGGPAINNQNQVIGIAVTGADKMSKAHETEKHCIIPIDVINLLN